MMDFRVDRETAVIQALDKVQLPQRMFPVEHECVQPRRQVRKLSPAAWRGKRRTAHVVVEVEIAVRDPLRHAGERDLETLVEGFADLVLTQALDQVTDEVPRVTFGWAKDLQRTHVAGAVGRF